LRGLAAIYILVFHTAKIPIPGLELPMWADGIISQGGAAVTLFLLISAFVLSFSSDRKKAAYHTDPAGYFLKRFFRIAPLFYSWVLISWVRDAIFFNVQSGPGKVLLNLTFLFNLVPGEEVGIVWASWFIGVLALLYVLFLLLDRWVSNLNQALTFFIVTVLLAEAFSPLAQYLPIADRLRSSYLYFNIIHMLPIFACGFLVYHLYTRTIRNRAIDSGWSLALLAGSAWVFSLILDQGRTFIVDRLVVQSLAFSLLVLGLAIKPWGLLVNKVTRFLGKISYSIYLNHPTVVWFLIPVYRIIYSWPVLTTLKFFVCLAITLAIVLPLSIGTYYLIEVNGSRLGQWVLNRRRLEEGRSS
jgi:peptidoglycan/LPS O-acetylase OafA/YrhL